MNKLTIELRWRLSQRVPSYREIQRWSNIWRNILRPHWKHHKMRLPTSRSYPQENDFLLLWRLTVMRWQQFNYKKSILPWISVFPSSMSAHTRHPTPIKAMHAPKMWSKPNRTFIKIHESERTVGIVMQSRSWQKKCGQFIHSLLLRVYYWGSIIENLFIENLLFRVN